MNTTMRNDPRLDRNAPNREPDGNVDGYFFWLGADADPDLGDVDDEQGDFEFPDNAVGS